MVTRLEVQIDFHHKKQAVDIASLEVQIDILKVQIDFDTLQVVNKLKGVSKWQFRKH